MSRRWRYPRNRRGEFWDFPKPVITPAAPDAVFPLITQRARRGFLPRRGDLWTVPQAQSSPSPQVGQVRRRTGVLVRRGEFLWVPPAAQAVAGAGPLIQPPFRQAIRRGFLARRGDLFWSPPSLPAGPGPLVQPPFRYGGRRGMLPRRGQFFEFPLVGLAPTVPAVPPATIHQRVVRPAYSRRGRFLPAVPGVPVPPQRIGRCRTYLPRMRRIHFIEPVWPFIPPQPSVWRPDLVRARRRPPALPYLRRAKRFLYPWEGLPVVPVGGILDVTDRLTSTVAGVERATVGLAASSRATADTATADRRTDTLKPANRDTPTLGTGD